MKRFLFHLHFLDIKVIAKVVVCFFSIKGARLKLIMLEHSFDAIVVIIIKHH